MRRIMKGGGGMHPSMLGRGGGAGRGGRTNQKRKAGAKGSKVVGRKGKTQEQKRKESLDWLKKTQGNKKNVPKSISSPKKTPKKSSTMKKVGVGVGGVAAGVVTYKGVQKLKKDSKEKKKK